MQHVVHTACIEMDMQYWHGHAAWIWICIKHAIQTWTWSMNMETQRLYRGVWYPSKQISTGSNTPRNKFSQGLIPLLTNSVGSDALPNFPECYCISLGGVWYPAEKISAGYQTPLQNFRCVWIPLMNFCGVSHLAKQLSNSNISAKSKPNSKIIEDMTQGSIYVRFVKNQRSKISCYCLFNVTFIDSQFLFCFSGFQCRNPLLYLFSLPGFLSFI